MRDCQEEYTSATVKSKAVKRPTFWYEKRAVGQGYDLVIGVDEVGRGAFAGPVVAGAVAFGSESFKNWVDLGIDDSKRLRARSREGLAKIIRENALWGIGEIGVATINKIGVARATQKAMRQAINKINKNNKGNKKTFVLVDAFHVKYIPGIGLPNQRGIIKGDQKVISIAAASIIAKVYRDRIMTRLSRQNRYNRYCWGRNKGYGTKDHQEAIKKYGTTRLHRLAFVKNII